MAKSPKKKPAKVREDANTTAFRTLQEITGAAERTLDPAAGKDPAAVARGRTGGAKGGKARAAKLTAAEKTAAGKKAAAVRWGKAVS